MWTEIRPALLTGALLVSALITVACSDSAKISAEQSKLHVTALAQTVQDDVSEIRKGLPEGAKHFVGLYRAKKPKPGAPATEAAAAAESGAAPVEGDAGTPAPAASAAPAAAGSAAPAVPAKAGTTSPEAPKAGTSAGDAGAAEPTGATDGGAPVALADGGVEAGAGAPTASAAAPGGVRDEGPDPATVREALMKAREKVADLRVAKSTFFALADTNGMVIRNDQDQDRMAGKGLFDAYGELRKALAGKVVETRGSMPEAAGVGNRNDGQWVIAAPVMVEGMPKALYVTGWSWSAYAYRLQFKLRSDIESSRDKGKNPPLVYVMMVVDGETYAWDAPDVDLRAVNDVSVFDKLQGDAVYSQILEVTGTRFGFAAKAVPVLGPRVAVAVLRAET